jgi:hypothetical protein
MGELFSYVAMEKFKDIFNGIPRKVKILLFSLPEKLENIEIIDNLIKSYHESPIGGHEGKSRTINRLKEKYIFKKMKSRVKSFINKCES